MNRADRVAQVQSFLQPGQGALLTEYRHRVFFLGFPSSAGTLFLTRDQRYFLVDFRYIELAGRIQDGFQVILQEDLPAQLPSLARENKITQVLADVELFSWEGWESAKALLPPGMLGESQELSHLLREMETHKTQQELEEESRAREIAQTVEERFAPFVRAGASVDLLRRKFTQLRGEAGDDSRTFAASFAGERPGCQGPLGERLQPGEVLTVRWEVVVGLTPWETTSRFPVKDLLPLPRRQRQASLKELLWEEHSGVLLCGSPNLRYYLAGNPGPGAWLLVTPKETLLLGDRDPGLGVDFQPKSRWKSILTRVVEEGLTTLYVEPGVPLGTLAQWRQLPCQVVPSRELEERIYRRRGVKREEELDRLRAAQAITDRVFWESLNYLRPGMTDVEIQRMVGLLFFDLGSQMESFNHVCGCGVDTSLPHVKPTGRVARKGDLVMLDIGAQVEGYGSDMTRMVGLGAVDQEKQEIYQLVLQAQLAGLQAAKAGAVCSQVDAAARQVIQDRGYGRYFLHGLGHPVGCGGREGPRFSQTDHSVLAPGVVMTVEPGVYLPGKFGVRIEDMVYIGNGFTENLTHSPKELICV